MVIQSLSFNRVFLSLLGVLQGERVSWERRLISKLSFWFMAFELFGSPVLIAATYMTAGSSDGRHYNLLTSVSLVAATISFIAKFTALHFYKKELAEAYEYLTEDMDEDTDDSKFTRKSLWALFGISSAVIVCYVYNPLADEGHKHGFRTVMRVELGGFSVPPNAVSLSYATALFVVAVGYDANVVFLSCRICNRFDSLARELESVGTNKSPHDQWETVKKCVDEHVLLLRFDSVARELESIGTCESPHAKWETVKELLKTLENLISIPFLLVVVFTVIVSCMTLAAALSMENWLNGSTQLAHSIGCMVHFFVYCRVGQQVTNSTGYLHFACYNNAWYNCTTEVKKLMGIVTLVSMKPKVLRGGFIFDLSYQMFWKVVSEVYTYTMIILSFI